MRYRDISLILARISEEWKTKSSALLAQLIEVQDEELRKEIIQDNANHWSLVKEPLASLSKNKCWYTEKKLTEQEMEVDHFRPKGKIKGNSVHPGYWWLSFDPKNFRLSSKTSNSKRRNTFSDDLDVFGKGTEFPLIDEAIRSDSQTARIDITNGQLGDEKPILLDPTNAADISLLDCDFTEGKIVETQVVELATEDNIKRCKESIRIYNLNSSCLLPERIRITRHLEPLLEEMKILSAGTLTELQKVRLNQIGSQIGLYISDDSEFSFYARAFLLTKISFNPAFINRILSRY
jgi:hypothetical protein